MMEAQQNIMRREAERAMSRLANTRIGIVSSYDPGAYAAKVRIQPEDVETGWLPIAAEQSGNGWGEYNAPSIGDVVEVQFQEGGKEAGFVGRRFYGDRFRPLPVPSGESWRVHRSGSLLKFKNDGTVELRAATAINSSAPVWNHAGPIIVDGYIKATGDIWDNYLTQSYTMAGFRIVYDTHLHYGVQAGPDLSGLTNKPI